MAEVSLGKCARRSPPGSQAEFAVAGTDRVRFGHAGHARRQGGGGRRCEDVDFVAAVGESRHDGVRHDHVADPGWCDHENSHSRSV